MSDEMSRCQCGHPECNALVRGQYARGHQARMQRMSAIVDISDWPSEAGPFPGPVPRCNRRRTIRWKLPFGFVLTRRTGLPCKQDIGHAGPHMPGWVSR